MIRQTLALVFRILLEMIVGFAIAAAVLAVCIPLLIRRSLIAPGDVTGPTVIAGVLVCSVGALLFRPGSAINRYGKRDK